MPLAPLAEHLSREMSWLHHPRFVPTRDRVVQAFKQPAYNFRDAKWIVFLCGGAGSLNRDRIAHYLAETQRQSLVFYADTVWQTLAAREDQNALQMEGELASLADVVCILVESPGTIAELGAFSLNPQLRRKLLLILDRRYRDEASFISTGPVRWVDSTSMFKPTIWTDTSVILQCASELDERLSRLGPRLGGRIADLRRSQKHLLFLICDLVVVLGPCSLEDIVWYVRAVVGNIERLAVDRLTALAFAMKLLQRYSINDVIYFDRTISAQHYPSFQITDYYKLPSLKAEVLGVLDKIPDAKSVRHRIKEIVTCN